MGDGDIVELGAVRGWFHGNFFVTVQKDCTLTGRVPGLELNMSVQLRVVHKKPELEVTSLYAIFLVLHTRCESVRRPVIVVEVQGDAFF